ncbi:hypothetical protein [Streptomyces sp. NPDC000410]|uniref:hypothetical protein n=1 Tax=Streptomyces sp. NPDC000410 TaxID=3154254 RepID=UPI00331691E6
MYEGELATDLWRAGQWWGGLVAARWEATVAASLASVRQEAERRATLPYGAERRRRFPGAAWSCQRCGG